MFTTPKKKSGNVAEGKTANGDATIVFENGTILGAVSGTPSSAGTKHLVIPEIVISASYSSNSLHRSRCDVGPQQTPSANSGGEDNAIESTALLEQHSDADQPTHDEFEQFVLNRTTSDSNILESSIYSELQFAPSAVDGVVVSGGPTGQVPAPQQPSSGGNVVVDVLNSSVCSRDSRQGKRTRRKHKSKSKCSVVSASGQRANVAANVVGATYPPQYTAIFLDHHHGGGAANAMGQIASAAASSPFLNAPLSGPADPGFLHHQQYQFYQQRPMLSSLGAMGHHHHHHRPLLEADVQQGALFSAPDGSIGPGAPAAGVPVPTPGSGAVGLTITAPTSTISPPLRASFRKWFSRPSLPFVIGILALGGVACTLGGIVLGSTGLIEHSTQYLSAALLMIGIGVSLLVISGAIWRLSIPDDVDECPCYRHMETCRNCNSPYCNNRLLPGSYLYPEFQHRPPPPSYQASMQEYRLRLLLLDRDRQNGVVRGNSPPPTYRSHAGSLLRAPLTTTIRGMSAGASSIGGSEYSLPPSYRSRNPTPGSIETAPSGRLLANEDLPEPLGAEQQLPDYSSLQHLRQLSADLSLQTPKSTTRSATVTTTPSSSSSATTTTTTTVNGASLVAHQLHTSANVEIEATNNNRNNNNSIVSVANDSKFGRRHQDLKSTTHSSASVGSGSAKGKELVTIVTISQNHDDMLASSAAGAAGAQDTTATNEQMEILAHL